MLCTEFRYQFDWVSVLPHRKFGEALYYLLSFSAARRRWRWLQLRQCLSRGFSFGFGNASGLCRTLVV